jgi:hypothetical protein
MFVATSGKSKHVQSNAFAALWFKILAITSKWGKKLAPNAKHSWMPQRTPKNPILMIMRSVALLKQQTRNAWLEDTFCSMLYLARWHRYRRTLSFHIQRAGLKQAPDV